ncbi:MAG: hypothetical protein U5J64_02915 [Halobacteriales archaeon]|nr:hypothetical protein [Halobacteriales archaeon]
MTTTGKDLIEQGEEMIERGEEMVQQGREMNLGETVVIDEGHEMKKFEMLSRGREMIERGEEKVERGHDLRRRDLVRNVRRELRLLIQRFTKVLSFSKVVWNLPVVVAFIAVVSGWFALEGIGYNRITPPTLLNPVYYVELLFVHSSREYFLVSMYFFVPSGLAMTYLTSNRKVFVTVAVSHVSAVVFTELLSGQIVTGTSAVAYGLLSATAVHAAYIGSKRYSFSTQTAAPISIFIISGIGILLIGTVSGGFFQNVPLIIGFAAGGSLECLTVISETRGTSAAEMEEMGSPAE